MRSRVLLTLILTSSAWANDLPPVGEELHSTQAAAVPYSAAQNSKADLAAMKIGWFSEHRGIELRPSVALQWFSMQSNRTSDLLLSGNWMGAQLEFDAALLRFPILELGTDLSFYRSLAGFGELARSSSVTSLHAAAYALLKANTSKFGIPMLRVSGGYHGNWRDSPEQGSFLPPASGFRIGTELSVIVDEIFAFGVLGGYTATRSGLFDVGAFLSHRLTEQTPLGLWSARIGATISLFQDASGRDSPLRETWVTVNAGVSSAF